jgi:hypothetical protein
MDIKEMSHSLELLSFLYVSRILISSVSLKVKIFRHPETSPLPSAIIEHLHSKSVKFRVAARSPSRLYTQGQIVFSSHSFPPPPPNSRSWLQEHPESPRDIFIASKILVVIPPANPTLLFFQDYPHRTACRKTISLNFLCKFIITNIWNYGNKGKLNLRRYQEQIKSKEWLLPFSAEYLIFLHRIQKNKQQTNKD